MINALTLSHVTSVAVSPSPIVAVVVTRTPIPVIAGIGIAIVGAGVPIGIVARSITIITRRCRGHGDNRAAGQENCRKERKQDFHSVPP